MTFDATLNPVVYEGGIPVFIDTDPDSWNMDPEALEKAFEMYPEVKLVVCAELYGFSGNIRQIKEICENTEHSLLKMQRRQWELHGRDSSAVPLVIMRLSAITAIRSLPDPLEDVFLPMIRRMQTKPENGVHRPGKMQRGISMKKSVITTGCLM